MKSNIRYADVLFIALGIAYVILSILNMFGKVQGKIILLCSIVSFIVSLVQIMDSIISVLKIIEVNVLKVSLCVLQAWHYEHIDLEKLEKEQEDSISSKDVSEDWMMRFFNSVQDISDEKMQLLWGKILAGEIKQPNSFSLRSLDAMTKISKDEAQLFEKLSSYIINFRGTYAILNNDDLNEKYSISYGQILALDECGIIDSSAMMSLTLGINEKATLEIVYDSQLLIASAKDERKIRIQIFKLTRIGMEIFKIISHCYNKEYFDEVAKILARENREISFSMHKILNKLEDERFEYIAQGTEVVPD